jgi:pyrroloquinoline quinone (PQQ) biosynthesis protein C
MAGKTEEARQQGTPDLEWAGRFWDELGPLKDQIMGHPYFRATEEGRLPQERCRAGLVDFYRLVENFPKYLSLNLAKMTPDANPGLGESRHRVIHHIYLAMLYADMWRDWARGFGCSELDLEAARPGPALDAIDHYLWSVNTYGSLAEGIGATRVAVEWPLGQWMKRLLLATRLHLEEGRAAVSPMTLAWLEAYLGEDDAQPSESLEMLTRCAITREEQRKALAATKRGMVYCLRALDDCFDASIASGGTTGL